MNVTPGRTLREGFFAWELLGQLRGSLFVPGVGAVPTELFHFVVKALQRGFACSQNA